MDVDKLNDILCSDEKDNNMIDSRLNYRPLHENGCFIPNLSSYPLRRMNSYDNNQIKY